MLLDSFVSAERLRVKSKGQQWRPLRHRPVIKSVTDLPPLRNRRLDTTDQSLQHFGQLAKSPILDSADSFETILRLHFRNASAMRLQTMLACAQPTFDAALARHQLWVELGGNKVPDGTLECTSPDEWKATVRPVCEAWKQARSCVEDGSYRRHAGKPVSSAWRSMWPSE